MQEIFKKLNRQNPTEKTEITIETNQQNIIGASMTKEHRIVYFETEQPEPFYIDFVPHSGTTNTIYLIPSYHLMYLPNSAKNFNCINIPQSCLNDIEKYWIFNLKYKSNKSFHFDTNTIYLHNRIISEVLASKFPAEQKSPSLQYIQIAESISEYLSNSICSHQMKVQEILNRLNITDKTLQRICNSVFSMKPKHIIRYHLILKIVFQIVGCKLNSFNEIADNLGFKDVSTFGRYVKTISKFTPNELRNLHSHIIF